MSNTPSAASNVRLVDLLITFLRVATTAIGGSTSAWVYREVVERRRWLNEKDFLTGLTFAQVLPGANPVNLCIYIGLQLRGVWGAVVAVLAMITPAFCVILLLGYLYRIFGNNPVVHAILGGVAAAGVGAMAAVGLKLAKHAIRGPVPALIAIAVFTSVGILRWPLVPVVLICVPMSVMLALLVKKGAPVDSRLIGLILVFAPLSALSFGGGQAVIVDIQHQTVVVHHWLSDRQFTDLYAISRVAPGPATLIAALIGWQVLGFAGALVATLAIYLPSSLIVYAAASWWHRHTQSPWRTAIERGLAPIALGLIFAGVLTVLEAAHILDAARIDWLGLGTMLVSMALLYYTRISPYLLIACVTFVYGAVQFA